MAKKLQKEKINITFAHTKLRAMKRNTNYQADTALAIVEPSEIAPIAVDGVVTIARPQTYEQLASLFVSEQDIKESSRALYRRTLLLFFKWIEGQGLTLDGLTITHVNGYKDSLIEQGHSRLTIGNYIVAVRKFYEWAEAKGYYRNIARNVKTPRGKDTFRKQHLSEEKSSELLAYFRRGRRSSRKSKSLKRALPAEALARDFAIVNLMLRTGLRVIEISRADIADITYKRERRVLKVFGKGRSDKEEDFVVLSDSAYKPIEAYLSQYRKTAKAGEPLFTSVSYQNKGKRLSTRTLSGICKEGLNKVHLEGKEYTAHSLRHTTAVAILKSTDSVTQVQAVLRHRSIDTSRIYLKSIEEERRLNAPAEYAIDGYFR